MERLAFNVSRRRSNDIFGECKYLDDVVAGQRQDWLSLIELQADVDYVRALRGNELIIARGRYIFITTFIGTEDCGIFFCYLLHLTPHPHEKPSTSHPP